MISSVDSSNNISAIRYFNAANAFKTQSVKPEPVLQEQEAGVDIKENSILKNIDVNEIKAFANSVGETNLSEDDIKYGLKYGRSVLVNYSA